MKCFDPTHVPAITTLASEFALFDQLRICSVCMCVYVCLSLYRHPHSRKQTHTKRLL